MERKQVKLEDLTIEDKRFILMAAIFDAEYQDPRDFIVAAIEDGYTGYAGMPNEAVEQEFKDLLDSCETREEKIQFLSSFDPWNNDQPIVI